MEPPLLEVHLHQLADANRVADSLGQRDDSVRPSAEGWTVAVLTKDQLNRVLSDLHACLGEHAIRTVRVTIDGKTYVMESGSIGPSEG
jgi:hypothetical protein